MPHRFRNSLEHLQFQNLCHSALTARSVWVSGAQGMTDTPFPSVHFLLQLKNTNLLPTGPIICPLCNQDSVEVCKHRDEQYHFLFSSTHSSPDQSITSKATLIPQILCYHQASRGKGSNIKLSKRDCQRELNQKNGPIDAAKSKSRIYQIIKLEI